MGQLATYPVLFVSALIAYFVFPRLWVGAALGGVIAYLYGVMAGLPDVRSFFAVSLIGSLLGSLTAHFLLSAIRRKKLWRGAVAVLALLCGILLPILYLGTPWQYAQKRQEARDYLAKTHPDQSFEEMRFHYDYRKREYRALLLYDYDGNRLSSECFFGEDGIRDGYLDDSVEWMLISRKTVFVELFREKEFSVVVDEVGLSEYEKDAVYHGTYGTMNEDLISKMHFSVTFRREKPERRFFAEACAEVLTALRENEIDFGRITFYALDAGDIVYRCIASSDTPTEELLSLVTENY
ncbi:MAG: hypothetical protein IKD31_03625 [Clostridia bacterium]|nr:hypothetical protein [Clostridia bacterium]